MKTTYERIYYSIFDKTLDETNRMYFKFYSGRKISDIKINLHFYVEDYLGQLMRDIASVAQLDRASYF